MIILNFVFILFLVFIAIEYIKLYVKYTTKQILVHSIILCLLYHKQLFYHIVKLTISEVQKVFFLCKNDKIAELRWYKDPWH